MEYKIGFIGAGKVGVTLGKYFSMHGTKVCGYFSKNSNSAREASEFTASICFRALKDLVNACNLIFITTPDNIIKEVWSEIKEFDLKDKIICHTSGSFSSLINSFFMLIPPKIMMQ